MTTAFMEPLEANDLNALAADVRRNRDDHVYSPYRDFESPLVIRGTNRVLFQAQALNEVEHPSRDALNNAIANFATADRQLGMVSWPNLALLKIVASTPEMLVLSMPDRDGATHYYALQTPAHGPELPLKRFSSMLSIPYSFSKKNPMKLNSVNFEYYLTLLNGDPDKHFPVDVVFNKTAIEASVTKADGTIETVSAHPIINLLRAKKETENSDITQRVPLFGSILNNVVRTIDESGMGLNPILQSYSTGYNSNRGRHYARLLFDKEELSIRFKGEPYQFGMFLESDFSGDFKDFGTVRLGFSLFRQICSNGMTVAYSDSERAELIELFVAQEMSRQGFTYSRDLPAPDENYEAAHMQARGRASMLFDPRGITIPVAQANLGFEASFITTILQFFIRSGDVITKQLESLDTPFGQVDREEFISTTLELQKSLKIKSPEMIKFFLLEYAAGEMTGDQVFDTPLAVLNYLTFISRSYDTATMNDMEAKALTLVQNLKTKLLEKEKESVSLFDQYAGQLSQNLLVAN